MRFNAATALLAPGAAICCSKELSLVELKVSLQKIKMEIEERKSKEIKKTKTKNN